MDFLNIQHAWVIALFAAIINIIPYVGPIIGFSFASIIVITTTQNIDLIPNLLLKTFILLQLFKTQTTLYFNQ